MRTMGSIAKSGKMTEGGKNYNYMQADDIFGKLQDALFDAGIAIIPNIKSATFTDVVSKTGNTGRHVVINMEFQITDGSDNMRSDWISEAIDYGDKAITKAGTLGRKYFIINLFQLATGDSKDDPDSDNQEGSQVSRSGTAEKPKATKQKLPEKTEGRPYQPGELLIKLQQTADKVPPASDAQLKLCSRILHEYFETEEIRHAFYEYIFGVTSMKDADLKMVNAVLKWLAIGEDWKPSKLAQDEIALVMEEVLA